MPYKSRDDELDRFWTIDELLPRKQSGARFPPQPHSTETVELTLDPPGSDEDGGASPLTFAGQTARTRGRQAKKNRWYTTPFPLGTLLKQNAGPIPSTSTTPKIR